MFLSRAVLCLALVAMALALAFVGVFSSAALGGDVSLVALSGVLSGPLALAGIVSGPLALAGGVFSGLASVSSVSVSGLSALALFAVAPVSAAPAQSSSWDGAILEHSRPVGDAQTGSFFRVVGHAGSVVEKLRMSCPRSPPLLPPLTDIHAQTFGATLARTSTSGASSSFSRMGPPRLPVC